MICVLCFIEDKALIRYNSRLIEVRRTSEIPRLDFAKGLTELLY